MDIYLKNSKREIIFHLYYGNYDSIQENEAKWLGGCLQLPRMALEWAFKKRMTEADIRRHFCVSNNMVKYRINMTGIRRQFAYVKSSAFIIAFLNFLLTKSELYFTPFIL